MTSGADCQQLEALAQQFSRAADRLDGSMSQLRALAAEAVWYGADAHQFAQKLQQLGPTVARHIHTMHEAAGDLRRNAEEQRQASTAESVGAGAGFGSMGAAAMGGMAASTSWQTPADRIPAGAHATTSDYVRELAGIKEGEFLLRKVSDGPPPRYVLLLRGAAVKTGGLNGLDTATQDYLGQNSAYQAAVRDVLRKLPPNAEIGIIGHSQGGIVGMDIAQTDPRVKDLLVLGSPIDHKAVPPGLRALEFEHRSDAIPGLDGGGFGNSHQIAKVHFDLNHEPSYGPWDHFAAAHNVPDNYQPAVDAASGSGPGVHFTDPGEAARASEFVRDFEARYGGGAGSDALGTVGPAPH